MSVYTKLEAARRIDRKRVRIRDLSAKGAQVVLESDTEMAKCDVLLKRGDLCTAAKVVWIKGDEIGLTFYREISQEKLASS